MKTYYVTANAGGLISKKVKAETEHEALQLAIDSGRSWIDDPATDAEDDFNFCGADTDYEECAQLLKGAGLYCVIRGDLETDWDVWTDV